MRRVRVRLPNETIYDDFVVRFNSVQFDDGYFVLDLTIVLDDTILDVPGFKIPMNEFLKALPEQE